jgi:GAF domain-containing protein
MVLGILFDVTRRFTSAGSLEDLLQTISDAAMKLLPGEHASVRVLDDAGTQLICGARSGAGAHVSPISFRRGEGIMGWVADHARVAHISDTTIDPRFKESGAQGFSVRSIIAVPLLSRGHVMGVIAITSPAVEAFSADDEILLVILANCAAAFVDMARLEHQARTQGAVT